MTWNCRGRNSTDSAASSVNANHWPPANRASPPAEPARPSSGASDGSAAARANRSAGPPNRPQVTKMPMARNASSLTTDSSAIAATMPSWRSEASRCRVPKAIVKPASSRAMYKVLSCHHGAPAEPSVPVSSMKPPAIALSCSAMYGRMPISAISVTSAASMRLLA